MKRSSHDAMKSLLLCVLLTVISATTLHAQQLGVLNQFDVGTEVKDWADVPGTHTVRFDAKGLSTGVYLIRLSTPTGSDTWRVMLLR